MNSRKVVLLFGILIILSLSSISASSEVFNVTTDSATFSLTTTVSDQLQLYLGEGLDTLSFSTGVFQDAETDGDILYATAGGSSGTLNAFNVSDPSNIVLLDSVSISYPQGFSISNGYAYVATSTGVSVVDISSPSSLGTPTLYEYITNYVHNALDTEVEGSNLYVYDDDEILVADISTPGSPSYVTSIDNCFGSSLVGESYGRIAVDNINHYLFVAGADRLAIFNTTVSSAPSCLNRVYSEDADTFVEYGDGVISTHKIEGTKVSYYNVTTGDVVYKGTFQDSSQPFRATSIYSAPINDGLIYITTYSYGITILNATDLENVQPISQWLDGTTYSTDGLSSIGFSEGVGFFASQTDDVVSAVNFSSYSATNGTYTSRIFDATSSTNWNSLVWNSTVPTGAVAQVSYRTCNDAACSGESFSSPSETSPIDLSSEADNQYFQFQVELSRGTDTSTSAVASNFNLTYGEELNNGYPIYEGYTYNIATSQFSPNNIITLPAIINSGDLLLATYASSSTIDAPSGWTSLGVISPDGSAATITIFGKVADGTEDGATVNFLRGSNGRSTVAVSRISNWPGNLDAVELDVGTSGYSGSPDSGNKTPSWGEAKNLWLSTWGGYYANSLTLNSVPTDYISQYHITTSDSNTYKLGLASRELLATSEDPGAFSINIGTTYWGAFTIAVASNAAFVDITPPIFVTIPDSTATDYRLWNGVYFNATDYNGVDTYSVNDSTFTINSTGYLTNVSSLSAGIYSLNISVNDTQGNINYTGYIVNLTEDVTAPLIDWSTGVESNESTVSTTNIYFNVSIIEENCNQTIFYWKKDVGAWESYESSSCETSYNKTGLLDGDYEYYVFADDIFGQSNQTSILYLTMDSTPVDLEITFPVDLVTYNYHNQTLAISASSSVSSLDTCIKNLNSQGNVTFDCSQNSTVNSSLGGTVEGTNTLEVWVNDTSGNANYNSVQFLIDTVGPTIDSYFDNNTIFSSNRAEITTFLSSIDAVYVAYSVDGGDAIQLTRYNNDWNYDSNRYNSNMGYNDYSYAPLDNTTYFITTGIAGVFDEYGSCVVFNDVVYCTAKTYESHAGNNYFTAVNATNGSIMWQYDLQGDSDVTPMLDISNESIMWVSTYNEQDTTFEGVYKFNINTNGEIAEQVCNFSTGNGGIAVGLEQSEDAVFGCAGPYTNQYCYAINKTDCSQIWSYNTDSDWTGAAAQPFYYEDYLVVLGIGTNTLKVLNATNGSLIWSNSLSDMYWDQQCRVFENNELWCSSSDTTDGDNAIRVYDITNGTVIFTKVDSGMKHSKITLYRDTIMYTTRNTREVQLLNYSDPAHAEICSVVIPQVSSTNEKSYHEPQCSNGICYVGSNDNTNGNPGTLMAFNATNCNIVWRYTNTSVGFWNKPAITDGILYIKAEGTGALMAFGAEQKYTYVANFTDTAGEHEITIVAQDALGNENSETYSIILNSTNETDTTLPLIEYVSPTQNNNSVVNNSWIYINVSIEETNEDTVTFNLYNDLFGVITSNYFSNGIHYINWTGLADGDYYYNVSVNDTSGNMNETPLYKITLNYTGSLDVTAPLITKVAPVGGETYLESSVYLEIQTNELSTCTFSLDSFSTNTTMDSTDNLTHNYTTNLSDGAYVVSYSCEDLSGNNNDSIIASFSISTSGETPTSGGGGGGGRMVSCYYISQNSTCEVDEFYLSCPTGYYENITSCQTDLKLYTSGSIFSKIESLSERLFNGSSNTLTIILIVAVLLIIIFLKDIKIYLRRRR